MVESWRPAGGEQLLKGLSEEDRKLTPTLGIARIPTWRLETLIESLKTLVENHGEIEEVTTEELVYGDESLIDIFVRFRSELVAEVVKTKIDGELVEGRKLQVNYA